MVLVWRRLLHSVVAMPVDGLPSAILAPEDQRGSDHQLGRLRAALELPPPALDEDPVGHITAHRQEGGVARDDARTGHELRRYPVPSFTDFRPAAFDATPEPALANGIGVGAQRLHGFGISVGDSGERLAELIQERLESIGGVLVDHGLLLLYGLFGCTPSKAADVGPRRLLLLIFIPSGWPCNEGHGTLG